MERIEKLSNSFGVAGFEDEVRELMKEELGRLADSVEVDPAGNLISTLEGNEKRVMIAAHLGEVGFSVKYIDEDGFLRFVNIGGFDERIIPSQPVIVKGDSHFEGVVGSKPPHLLEDEEKEEPIEEEKLFIDVGAADREEVKEFGIEKGSPATFSTTFNSRGEMIMGKAFDDRLGCAALLELAEKDYKPTVNLVVTSREEVGLKGARVAAYRLNPDYAFVMETAAAGDHPEVSSKECDIEIGGGPVLNLVESSGRGAIMSPPVRDLLVETAEEEGIDYQIDIIKRGMTDAAVIQLTRKGIPAGSIGIPTRYIHQPKAVAKIGDWHASIDLLASALGRI